MKRGLKRKSKATKDSFPEGLIIVFTGNGKGKTSAALGMALRAAGHGYKTAMVKFIKGPMTSGEDFMAQKLPFIKIINTGKGFYKMGGDSLPPEEHKKAAQRGLDIATKMMRSRTFDIVILDEINVALSAGLLTFHQLKKFIKEKPDHVHLILTGRKAPKGLLKIADLITDMKEIKHPFKKGLPARKGIDY